MTDITVERTVDFSIEKEDFLVFLDEFGIGGESVAVPESLKVQTHNGVVQVKFDVSEIVSTA